MYVPVNEVEPNPYQPRLTFDPAEMTDLVASVKEHGVQQPVIVRTIKTERDESEPQRTKLQEEAAGANSHASNGFNGNGSSGKHSSNANGSKSHSVVLPRYQLVTGERRLRASKQAGRKHIPAIVRDDLTNVQVASLALTENLQRSNLTVIEEARGYKRLMIEFRMKEERIARKVGKSLQTIRDTLRLLALPDQVQALLSQKKLSASHGHALLDLAPFETICLSVANHAATAPLTATALASAPLPNAASLKQKGLLVELDHRTKFDWTQVCASCSHHAYVRSGYHSYCLNPIEWKSKQEAAIEMQKQEAARVMEEARQEGRSTVEVESLPANSYRDLSYVQLPAGCSGSCPCRSEAAHPADPTKKISICLDPNRLSELREAERKAHQEQRQRRANALWSEAKGVLEAEISQGDEQRAAFLVALPILRGERLRWGGDPEEWQQMVEQVGRELGLPVPWNEFYDPDTDEAKSFALLREHKVEGEQLLLLASCLLLAQEAMSVIRFAGETPNLSFVLGHERVSQLELGEDEATEKAPAEEAPSGEDLPDGDPPEDGSTEGFRLGDSLLDEGLPDEDLPEGWPTEDELRENYEEDESEELEHIDEIGADDFNAAGFDHNEFGSEAITHADPAFAFEAQSLNANGVKNKGLHSDGGKADNDESEAVEAEAQETQPDAESEEQSDEVRSREEQPVTVG